jgi:hypothetical protein
MEDDGCKQPSLRSPAQEDEVGLSGDGSPQPPGSKGNESPCEVIRRGCSEGHEKLRSSVTVLEIRPHDHPIPDPPRVCGSGARSDDPSRRSL